MDNSINNINNNLYNIDLLMLGNKGKKYNINNTYNTSINNEDLNNIEYIIKDFKIYKKQIKNKINDLYTSYLDNSNNNIILNNKVDGYFYFFIKSIIDDIKNEHIKFTIQNELTNYNNKNNKNNKNNENNEKDTSYNDLISNNKNKNKNRNMEHYLDIKKINNVKILPKKRF